MALSDYNPFTKKSEYSSSSLNTYKVLTLLSWLLVVVFGTYYTFRSPDEDHHHHKLYATIWNQNRNRPTPFSLNAAVTSVYWIIVLLLQLHYVRYLWSADKEVLNSAAHVGSHFILHNLLTFGFIMLWVRGMFWIGEILLVINLFNLTILYFRHPTTTRFIHIPIISAPYAWTFVAILWDGAAMVNARSLPARILANIAIWGILGVGVFFVLAFRDYTIGFELAILSLSLALAQLATHVIALQWIFAFVIMGCLIVLSLLVSVPGFLGKKDGPTTEDRERAPLLASS